jgi:NitT/TauT family transport system permease protein
MRLPTFFGVHASPPRWLGRVLALAPFVVLIAIYFAASHTRLAENPDDKILPSFEQMASAVVVTFVSIIPPLAVLPILFITFGVDEAAKVMLIFLGTFALITRDIYGTVKAMPQEQLTKALTLGASQLQLVYRIVLPQIVPRLIDTVRLSLGGGWLFLIAAEAIASTDGLGYRIFLVRRYLAMDVIIPYVLWITLLGFTIDWSLRRIVRSRYRWYAS